MEVKAPVEAERLGTPVATTAMYAVQGCKRRKNHAQPLSVNASV